MWNIRQFWEAYGISIGSVVCLPTVNCAPDSPANAIARLRSLMRYIAMLSWFDRRRALRNYNRSQHLLVPEILSGKPDDRQSWKMSLNMKDCISISISFGRSQGGLSLIDTSLPEQITWSNTCWAKGIDRVAGCSRATFIKRSCRKDKLSGKFSSRLYGVLARNCEHHTCNKIQEAFR